MKLYLVRHGQTDYNVMDLAQGSSDIPLNETGRAQAQGLMQKIKQNNLQFDIYYMSPLVRARETASIITNGGADFIVDDLLVERSFGELEGTKVDYGKLGDVFDRRLNLGTHGIEPIKTLLARAKAFLDKITTAYGDDVSILVVAHGTLLKAMHYNIVGCDDDTDFRTFHMENCEICEYDIPSRRS